MAQFTDGVKDCLPTILGYWSIGFAAGAIGSVSGFSILQIGALAALLYAGSAQFLFYSLHAAGAGMLSIVLGVLLINLRYVLMSSYMARYFTQAGTLQKLVGGALLTDETFGVAAQRGSRHGELPFAWLLGLNLTAWLNWIVANLAGAWLAAALPESVLEGLGFSLVSMFIGLLLMTWLASRTRLLEGVAIAASILIVLASARLVGVNLVILLATVGAATTATLLQRAMPASKTVNE
ncbi:AzlC family ABC transporter permease [Variovorax paradoxus]|jgi:4-azaleucine resistance transporter AzlC|uniref:AzlC family ABC transporter permease n=1 Tax=Variovorax paradoxus TaxID=34073 RepID=UPI0029C9AFAE|nr:AzlC family ABC transporter permease [Variovorax paradoxus]WPH23072.1 AzlC family ABC transporter permease [Variovorax paradoxus]